MSTNYHSTKIIELLRDYNAIILCRTLPRLAGPRSQKNGTSIGDAYKYLLQEKIVSLNTNDGMHDHISDFSMYCVENNLHLLYTDLLKTVIFAFCASDVVKQLGERRRQQVIRGIFVKSFQEAANLLIKTPAIFDMAVNRSDNCFEPCQHIAANAIDTIKMNVFNDEINGIAMSTTSGATNTVTVPAKTYDVLKKKYDVALALQTKHGHDMNQAISKIKTLADALKKAKIEIQALRARMRDIESIPREISFVSDDHRDDANSGPTDIQAVGTVGVSNSHELSIIGSSSGNDDINEDDSVSQVGKKSTKKTKGASSKRSFMSDARIKDQQEAAATAASTKVDNDDTSSVVSRTSSSRSSKASKTTKKKPIDDEDVLDVDEFNSFFSE